MTVKKQILTVKNIRNINMENILQSIIRSRNTTRSMLSKENHISLMTVKHVVDTLICAGLLEEKESTNSDVGRNPKVLELAKQYGNIICVNLADKEKIRFLIYDIYQHLLMEKEIPLGDGDTYQESLMKAVEAVQRAREELDTETAGIAVFVPSAYDEDVDQVNYDLIPEFKDLHIREVFEEAFNVDNILILHDVFAAARSEYDSLNPELESQFYFYCGYGVGGYYIHKNIAVAGEENMAGEVGKMLLSMDGDSESLATLEEIVSVSAVKQKMQENGMDLRFAELIELYERGDEKARKILQPVLETISKVLYNLLWVYNPTRIVIDSCKSDYTRVIAKHFQTFTERMKNDAIPIHTQIREAKYDEYHMMRGCFYMARNAWIEGVARELQ